ncbi:hypothetical protein [Cesiribacter sp. SM1]|uniref:hypothetical protein n=1 Tax=Cesiribacter sp. SM1 TaxID=2861196 RepID=UPI001CD6FB11|nr:hypothetical protein [Cesiribacter sp. SM1]
MYSNLYSTPRQYNFILRQLSLFRQSWSVAAAAIFGLLFIISVFIGYFKSTGLYQLPAGLYYGFLTLIGLIFTSQIFQELHTPNRSYAFLTLPVSTLEKLIASWLLSSPIFILAYTAATFLIYLISTLVAGMPEMALEYFTDEYWSTIANYMVIQTIFLWGACYFRKNNFLKTVLVLVVLPMVIGLYALLLILLFFGGASNININPDTVTINDTVLPNLGLFMKILWYAVLGPYMLLTTYFTLKERQL